MAINALRLSFAFTETILDAQQPTGVAIPLGSFLTEPGYIAAVDSLQAGDRSDGGLPLELAVPWPYPAGQHFWDAYLDEKQPGKATGKLCFKKLVPLRLPKLTEKAQIVFPDMRGPEAARIDIEGFYYPHGTGLLVTITLEGELDIVRAGSLALGLRQQKVFQITWPGACSAVLLSLDQLATAALDQLRQKGFGDEFSGAQSAPFSIATVLKGTGFDPNSPPVPDGEVHRLLHGLSSWSPFWQNLAAPPLVVGSTQLHLKRATAWPGNLLFASARGRAVWFPGQFQPQSPPVHRLGCFHRNLSLGSLQVESLLTLASATEGTFAQRLKMF